MHYYKYTFRHKSFIYRVYNKCLLSKVLEKVFNIKEQFDTKKSVYFNSGIGTQTLFCITLVLNVLFL